MSCFKSSRRWPLGPCGGREGPAAGGPQQGAPRPPSPSAASEGSRRGAEAACYQEALRRLAFFTPKLPPSSSPPLTPPPYQYRYESHCAD